jgi:hypothetical protein
MLFPVSMFNHVNYIFNHGLGHFIWQARLLPSQFAFGSSGLRPKNL